MNRLLLLRRCSMSSIEEEDESTASDEFNVPIETVPSILSTSSSSLPQNGEQSMAMPEWDSEISESEQEFDDNNEKTIDDGEEEAANRVLQGFIQSSSRPHQTLKSRSKDCYSPFSVHLYDEQDSTELDLIISELQDIKAEFDECSSNKNFIKKMNHQKSTSSSSKISDTNGCVHELRTLEDQLEAALASLTLTINDHIPNNLNCQQARSCDSSASSSGVGEEISNDSFHLYNNNNNNNSTTLSKTTTIVDDADSAYSDSGSADKILLLTNHDESLLSRSMAPGSNSQIEMRPVLVDHDEPLISSTQHPSKILIRTYNDDGSTKSIFIDDSMFVRDVLFILIHKNHREPNLDYALIEILPDLHMERIFEDHQKLCEAILMWPTISSNRLSFTRRLEKYSLLQSIGKNSIHDSADLEGNIYLKEKSRKSWKKHFCVLRSSGLYFVPKGKSKKDLICLAKFENVELFFGLDWKKKFKSPTDFCFALKHPLIQKKSSKYIKYMCVETKIDFDRWIVNIRQAKFGQQLKMNYLLMERAMNIYRASGRFVSNCPNRNEIPVETRPHPNPPVVVIQKGAEARRTVDEINDEEKKIDEQSPIKSPSYMDELRQRLERVLHDQSQEKPAISRAPPFSPNLPPSTEIRRIKNPTAIGSTPLPRKQLTTVANLSYRTIHPPNRYPSSQMSKSFTISTKREENRSSSSLSIASNSESLSLDETDFKIPTTTLHKSTTNIIKSKTNVSNSTQINRSKTNLLPKKSNNGITSPTLKPSNSIVSTRSTNKFIHSTIPTSSSCTSKIAPVAAVKPLPLVPPRKSSISNATMSTSQRDLFTSNSYRRTHVSHL